MGQANLHKNAECAVALANHIYRQMRELEVTKHGLVNDVSESKPRHPRRRPFPATVSEWKERQKEKDQRRLITDLSLSRSFGSEHEESTQGGSPYPPTQIIDSDIEPRIVADESSEGKSPGVTSAEIDHFLRQIRNQVRENSNQGGGLDIMNPPQKKVQEKPLMPDLSKAKPSDKKTGVGLAGFLFCVQEPNIKFKKIVNIRNAICILDNKCMSRKRKPENPRAAIICSINMNIWPISDYCNRDMATGLLKGSDIGDIYVVSLYCDGTKTPTVPILFKQLVSLANRENRQVLALMDSNSHSTSLWASKTTDNRGRDWEEFIGESRQLTVLNKGDHFTFMSKKGQSIIDVSLSTPRVAERISQWRVADCVPFSDHLSIEMLLSTTGCWTNPPASWNLGDKTFKATEFTRIMEEKSALYNHCNLWDPADMDRNGMAIVNDMIDSLNQTATISSRPINIARAGWFDAECNKLLRRCKQIRSYIRNFIRRSRKQGIPDPMSHNMRYSWQDYIACRRSFRRRCRRVKRQHYRRMIASIASPELVAKLAKSLRKSANAEIECFSHPSGERCTPAESVQLLKDTHFPNSTNCPPSMPREFQDNGIVDITDEEASFINTKSVKTCIASFKSHKAPGPDKLKMLPFKLLGPKALNRLVELYKASFLLGAMPECFRSILVVFIPKADKPAYNVPKAHRPISLMNNIMKIPEKLFLWRQEDTNLKEKPLEGEQHGFVKARSCDSAITVVTSHIEWALNKDWFAVVAFLDFQGAYDALQNQSMLNALRDMGTHTNIISWYKDFFYHRKSIIGIKGIQTVVYHTQGAPQGGIGSPFLWAAVLNELIKLIKDMDGIKIIAYADDLCLMAIGPDKDLCIKQLQEAVNAVMTWAGQHFLALSPSKSETVIFTKKRRYPTIIETAARIIIEGKPLNYETGAVRYLGIWMDRSLRWTEHIRIKTQKVRGLMCKLAGVSGDLWGFKPMIGKYCWEGLARPVLSYGCIGWLPAVMRSKTVVKELTKVQRLGYKLMAFFRRGTPNKGLDMLFNILPIDCHLLETAAKSYIRTLPVAPYRGDEMHSDVMARVSHRTWIEEFIDDSSLEYLCNPLDYVPLHRRWDKIYYIDFQSMNKENPQAGIPLYTADLEVYTDGSQKKCPVLGDKVGAGLIFVKDKKALVFNKRWAAWSYTLNPKNTVFQAEIYAVKKACQIMLQHTSDKATPWFSKLEEVDIYCDSTSAILALHSPFVRSKLVDETIDLLNKVAQETKRLTIRWTRGHRGHIGNERADKMAKKGRDSRSPPVADCPLIARATVNYEIEQATRKLWKAMWRLEPTCRQTKDWFPEGPRVDFAFDCLRLPRPICSQVIHFVTGHNFLQRHQAIIFESEKRGYEKALEELEEDYEGIIDSPISSCTLCGKDEESSYHIMTECEKLSTIRLAVFGKEDIPPPYTYIKVYQLVSYLRDVKLKSLEMRPFVEEFKASELPERMPDWAKVNGNDDSSDDEFQANTRMAKECGDRLLQKILYQK